MTEPSTLSQNRAIVADKRRRSLYQLKRQESVTKTEGKIHLWVEIIASSEGEIATDDPNDVTYILQLTYGETIKWQIERTYKSMIYFAADLSEYEAAGSLEDLRFPYEKNPSVESLERFFQDVMTLFGDKIWNFPLILSYFDDFADKSNTTSIRMMRMEKEVESIKASNGQLLHKLSENEALTLAVYDIMRILQCRVSDFERTLGQNVTGSASYSPKQSMSVSEELKKLSQALSNKSANLPNHSDDNLKDDIPVNLTHESFGSTSHSVRTSVESCALSWPQLHSSTTLQMNPITHTSGLSVVNESNSENSPTSIDSRRFQNADIVNDTVEENSEDNGLIPSPPTTNRKDGAYDYWGVQSRDNLKIFSEKSASVFSKVSQTAIEDDTVDNELSLLATALAAAPSNAIRIDSTNPDFSVWDMPNPTDNKSYFRDGNFEDDTGSFSKAVDNNISLPTGIYDTKSYLLPRSMVPLNEILSPFDEAVEEIITIVKPHEPQLVYRSSVKCFLSKQVKRALGSRVFEIGLHSLRCFLPDDPIRLSVTLWKNHSGHWHTHLSDRLCRLSEQGKISEDDIIDQNYDDIPSHMDHTICNVTYANSNVVSNDFHIFCLVDSLAVEISSNCRTELCLLAFFEEIAILVGKSNLFKRSILLIRAWWVYETTNYIGSSIKHYLPEFAMMIMITAIFNKYHDRIFHPIQALSMFLSEYADADWSNVVITIQGFMLFRSDVNNQPLLINPDPIHLIQQPMLDKYWDIVNLPGEVMTEVVPDSKSENEPSNSSAADRAAGEMARDVSSSVLVEEDTPRGFPNLSTNVPQIDTNLDNDDGASRSQPVITNSTIPIQVLNTEKIASGREAALESFERRSINIMHPLTYSNMMSDKCNVRRAKRISKVFNMAAKNMHAVLKLAASTGVMSVQTAIKNFFRTTFTRFGSGWRPDVLGNTIWIKSGQSDVNDVHSQASWVDNWYETSRVGQDKGDDGIGDDDSELSDVTRDLMRVSSDRLWDEILYCSLVLEGKISESALLMLTKEILIERGTLPVGEIGKMLQELTSMTTLSSKLKEKFGGLKKFLEKFSEHFIIGSDHPFNPHVYLRQTLSSEDLEVINRGSVPPQLLAKFKKMVVVRKKKINPLPPPPSNLEYGPWTGTQYMGLSQVPPHPFSLQPSSSPSNNSPSKRSNNFSSQSSVKSNSLHSDTSIGNATVPNISNIQISSSAQPSPLFVSQDMKSFANNNHNTQFSSVSDNMMNSLQHRGSLSTESATHPHAVPLVTNSNPRGGESHRDVNYHNYSSANRKSRRDFGAINEDLVANMNMAPLMPDNAPSANAPGSYNMQNPMYMNDHNPASNHAFDEWNVNAVSSRPNMNMPPNTLGNMNNVQPNVNVNMRVRSLPRNVPYSSRIPPAYHTGALNNPASNQYDMMGNVPHSNPQQYPSHYFTQGVNQSVPGPMPGSNLELPREIPNRENREYMRDMNNPHANRYIPHNTYNHHNSHPAHQSHPSYHY